MTELEIMWVAGFLEGEGCFFTSPTNSPGVKVCLTDKDVLDKYGKLIDRPVKGPYSDNRIGYKVRWEVNLYGKPAIVLMQSILPHMGGRRSIKIQKIIVDANNHELKRPISVRSLNATCHPEKKRYHSDGRCHNCYERDRRHNKKEK